MADKDGDSTLGKVQQAVGWLTGDREAEAKGKLRRVEGEGGGAGPEADEVVAEAEADVREKYGEHDPAVDDAPVADTTRPGDPAPGEPDHPGTRP